MLTYNQSSLRFVSTLLLFISETVWNHWQELCCVTHVLVLRVCSPVHVNKQNRAPLLKTFSHSADGLKLHRVPLIYIAFTVGSDQLSKA